MTKTYEKASSHRNSAALTNIGSTGNSDVESIMADLDTYLTDSISGSDYINRILYMFYDGLGLVSSNIHEMYNHAFTFRGVKSFPDGIKFANEALKYYDEGTWTAADASGDATPAVASSSLSRYVRIGNVVYFNVAVTYISNASATNAKISGPPYTVVGANRSCYVWTSANTFGAYGELVANGGSGRTDIQFWRRIPADLPNHQRVTNADVSTRDVYCYGMFFV